MAQLTENGFSSFLSHLFSTALYLSVFLFRKHNLGSLFLLAFWCCHFIVVLVEATLKKK